MANLEYGKTYNVEVMDEITGDMHTFGVTVEQSVVKIKAKGRDEELEVEIEVWDDQFRTMSFNDRYADDPIVTKLGIMPIKCEWVNTPLTGPDEGLVRVELKKERNK